MEKKQSRVEERLNKLEESNKFLGSKQDDQQVQLTKISKVNKDLAKKPVVK